MLVSPETMDVVNRAEALYESKLKELLEANHRDEFVVIDPDSGEYFLGNTMSEAAEAARKEHPDRRGFMMRVGHKVAVDLPHVLEIIRDN